MLQTERLLLRDIVATDFDAVHAYASDLEVVEFMTWGPNTEQDTRDFLERNAAQASVDPRIDYGLAVVRLEDQRMLGAVGLHMESEGAHQAMLGYCYARDAWRRGYATEAAIALMSFGFDVLGLHRIWAGCDPDNAASIRGHREARDVSGGSFSRQRAGSWCSQRHPLIRYIGRRMEERRPLKAPRPRTEPYDARSRVAVPPPWLNELQTHAGVSCAERNQGRHRAEHGP